MQRTRLWTEGDQINLNQDEEILEDSQKNVANHKCEHFINMKVESGVQWDATVSMFTSGRVGDTSVNSGNTMYG